MLNSSDKKIVYANKTQEPAFSSSAAAKEEPQRITQKIGSQPKIIDMPHQTSLGDGFIAVWGDVVLTPVDSGNMTKLADGQSPKLGFLVDFITDFQRSAKNGLPVYRIGGSAGLVLAVSYGKPDKGTRRLIAVDASKFSAPAENSVHKIRLSLNRNQQRITHRLLLTLLNHQMLRIDLLSFPNQRQTPTSMLCNLHYSQLLKRTSNKRKLQN